MEKVAAIFDEVQRLPSASNKASIPKINKILQNESDENESSILHGIWRGCLDRCLLCAKKEKKVDKMIDFLSCFVSSKATSDKVFNSCIEHLLERSKATNKVIRLRACQMIQRVIVGTEDTGKEMYEDTIKSIVDTLLPRLKDKVPGVRVWALKILSHLHEEGDGINEEILRLMQCDSSKDVRVAAVENVRLSKETLSALIARVKDVRPEVRIAVYTRLSAKDIVSAKKMAAPSFALIVRFGLGDRDPTVKAACKILVLKWLGDYKNDVPKFFDKMDFEQYEEEAETLGYAVMEIVDREESAPHDLSVAVRQHAPVWASQVSKMVASELLWVQIRCDYAKKNMSPTALADFVDALVPDMVKICTLLQDARKPALYSSEKYQMIVRYLLRLTTFSDTSDVCGCKELVAVCEEMLADTNLPEMLVEPMLHSWLLASSFSSSESIQAAVSLSERVKHTPGSSPKGVRRASDEFSLPGDSDEEEDGEAEERLLTLSSIRSLQIISWSLQLNIGGRDTVKGVEHYDSALPFVMDCLQQPCPDLRGLSVKCLGLLALTAEEKCSDLHEILFQVARNEIEENDIRNHAIEAIVDMATVYEQRYKDDHSLTMFLLRLQEQSEPALLRVGAECSAKLLFNGRLSDPKLFSNLLKFFFLPQLAGEVERADSEESEMIPADAYIGSLPRLQQILSVFFQVFFMGGSTWDLIAFRCTSDLVADLSMLIRDGALDPTAITMITSRLLALCENINLPVSPEIREEHSMPDNAADKDYPELARNIFRLRLSAAISREILKMGSSRVEKAAVKEYVKALGALSAHSWLQKNMVRAVLSVTSTIAQTCPVEKASQKILVEKIISVCEEVGGDLAGDLSEEEQLERDRYHCYAPGLADLIELAGREVHEDATRELREGGRLFMAESSREVKKKTIRRSNDKVDDDESGEEEEEEDEDTPPPPPVSSRPSRGSKDAAAVKIAAQLSETDSRPSKKGSEKH